MSEKNMNWEFLANKDYAFLTEDPALGDNVILLTYGGSHAYGTNIATSDTDIRGITFNPIESLLGNTEFEQFEDRNTDTVIYGLNKMIDLLLSCNPNCIEILGCKPEHYFIISPEGQLLLDNRKIFLSRRAIKTFGGYANSQLRRLQNALARDSYPQAEKLAILIDMAKIENYHKVSDILMKYPNKVSKSVCNIMECRKELITDSIRSIRHLLSRYQKEDIIKTINFKLAKMISDENAGKSMIQCLYKVQDIVEEICSNPCEYCYDLKHLDINGHDLKNIGIPDVEISHYLNGLLQLVIAGAVENNNEKLIEVARISRF